MGFTRLSKDELGNRMKGYEFVETAKSLDARLPIYARLDGRGFSKFTKGLERPFDEEFSNCMIETTKHLMQETNAIAGYTQSDEISLVWKPLTEEKSSFLFDGKIQKLTSILSGLATSKFMCILPAELRVKLPHFDCRIINLPNEIEACNMIAWREIDARKNAVSMLARCYFDHKELMKKSGNTMTEMLSEKGVEFNSYPTHFRNGSLFIRRNEFRELTPEELEVIPVDFRPSGKVNRSVVRTFDNPPFSRVENKTEVIFGS